uniref:Uncharacterized protein n=1 Tax=Panagrolaimus sp. ES5 TaxID=591445 RepID=A0AC34GFM7_9BILA
DSDDDDDEVGDELEDVFSSDEGAEDSSDEDEVEEANEKGLMEIERKSIKLLKQQAKKQKLGDEELELNVRSDAKFDLPSVEDVEEQLKAIPNLEVVKERMMDVIQVLGDFSKRRQDGKSRKDYLSILQKDLCAYYSYNEFLMEKFMQLFPNFSEVSEKQRN